MDPTSTSDKSTHQPGFTHARNQTNCEEAQNRPDPTNDTVTRELRNVPSSSSESEEEEMYKNLFPLRQLWKPKFEYPLWDDDWDGKQGIPSASGNVEEDFKREVMVFKNGVTRHIILIRHGQYDETYEVNICLRLRKHSIVMHIQSHIYCFPSFVDTRTIQGG